MKANLLLFILIFTPLLSLRAQELKVNVLLLDKTILNGTVTPLKAGTTEIQFKAEGQEALRSIKKETIDKLHFDLTLLKPGTLQVYFQSAQYDQVINGLKGLIVPYFSFVDIDCNSNDIIEMFVESLYRTGNIPGVTAARKEISKYQVSGELRRFADVFQALSYLDKGQLEKYAKYESYFQKVQREDPLAPALWMGRAKAAKLREQTDREITELAKIIVETPMRTEWSAEALYMSAVYNQTRTNLVVANQICQEIQIIAPLTHWPDKAKKLQDEVKNQAAELQVELVEFGEFRKGETQAGEAKVDYRERQRALEEQEIEFTE